MGTMKEARSYSREATATLATVGQAHSRSYALCFLSLRELLTPHSLQSLRIIRKSWLTMIIAHCCICRGVGLDLLVALDFPRHPGPQTWNDCAMWFRSLNSKGPSTQELNTRDFGTCNHGTGVWEVYACWVLGPVA